MVVRWGALRASAAWVAVGLFAIGLSCVGEIDVSVASTDLDASPGALVTLAFVVRNTDPVAATAELSFELPTSWNLLGAQETVPIPAETEVTLFATVLVPSAAQAGSYDLSLTATAVDDASNQSTAVAAVHVEPVSRIELVLPDGRAVAPGATAEYEATLTNRGTLQERVVLRATSSQGFPVSLSQTTLDLAPQESADIHVSLVVPVTAVPGQDVLTILAMSTVHRGVEDQGLVFTTILPPTADLIGRTLFEILSGRLRFSLDRDELTDDFDSHMSLSASGSVLDGFFSSFLSIANPLGPDPVDVTSYSILYRRAPTTTSIGNVSKHLTDLVSLTCEGGSIEIDEDLFDLAVVAGLSDDEARFGGRFALGPDVANVGITYFETRSPAERDVIVGGTAQARPLEDWRLSLEGAAGLLDGITSFAFLFATEIDTNGYFLDGEAFSIGSYFPGARQDTAGIRLSQRLRMTNLSIGLSLSHEWDNVNRNPLLPTQIEDQVGLSVSSTPIEDGPLVGSTIEFGWAREDDPTDMSEMDLLLSMGVRQTEGVFPYAFSGEMDSQLDLVLGTHVRTLTFSEGAGISVDSFYLFLELTHEKHVDVVADTVLSGATDVSILFRPEGTLHEASISARNEGDTLELTTSLFIRPLDSVEIVFDGAIAWDRADASPVSFGWGISFSVDLAVPLPFLVTKGQIEGTLFIDADGDGVFAEGERPISGATLSVGGAAVSTDADGFFRLPPLAPGTYALSIDALPAGVGRPDPIEAAVEAGQTVVLWVPLRSASGPAIEGLLFADEDRDGSRDPDEAALPGVTVRLESGEVPEVQSTTDSSGRFAFTGLAEGRYTLSVDPATLPSGFALTGPGTIVFDVPRDEPGPILFGAALRPPASTGSVQPPTADFSISPAEPAAGDTVTFDAGRSADPDGRVVAYAWDFDGNGIADAVTPVATWTFAAAGDVEVALTVTDDDGNHDEVRRTIAVRPASETGEPTPPAGTSPSIRPPVADFSISPSVGTVGLPIAFDGGASFDFDGRIVSYGWDFDGDGVDDATGPAALRIYRTPGTYEVTLRVTDDGGNTDALTRTVEVTGDEQPSEVDLRPDLEPPTAAFSYVPGEPVSGEPVTFDGSASSAPSAAIATYAWDFDGDGVVDATGALVEHTFVVAGTYLVTLTVTNEAGTDDAVSHAVDVTAAEVLPPESGDETVLPPIADFSFAPEAPLMGEPVQFNGMISFDFDGDIVGYAWDFDRNGTIDATTPIALHVFPTAGTFSVRLTVTDSDGATDTIERSIVVQ